MFRRPAAAHSFVLVLLLLPVALVGAGPQELGVSPAAQPSLQADRPLPDAEWFTEQVRARLKTDNELLRQYTYRERRRDIEVSPLGKVSLGPVREFEVYPSPIPGETYKRLVAVDGKPLTPEELAEQDRDHREDLLERQEKLQNETPEERAERLAERAEELQEEREKIEDGFRVYNFHLVGRDVLDGRQVIVVDLVPKEDPETKTRIGKYMKNMRGRAWVNEQDFEVVQVDVEVMEDVNIGWGILGRLHKGSEIRFRRKKVNNEIWLPSMMDIKMSGRTFIFRTFALQTTTEYSDYRKFTVETDERVALPKTPDEHE